MFKIFPLKDGLKNVEGFYFDGVSAGFKKDKNPDIGFIRSDELCDISAVFTTNRFQAAPIKHFLKYEKGFKTNFILLNSKNANAMTGKKGIEDIEDILSHIPNAINPVMSSTGVIGYRLDKHKFVEAIKEFDFIKRDSDRVARAIMTTDSFKKELAFEVVLEGGEKFYISAIAKGAGMINPAMATMLCFVITDANIPKSDMDELLSESVENSFNRISVDGDTSTNDTVMLLSNKRSGVYQKEAFKEVLNMLLFELSQMILRDGEGANKVVAFEVKGAKTMEDAKKASKALSNSLLVKTALFGEDPNWGRIASTIGASGIECDEEKLQIWYDELLIYGKNRRELDKKTEKKAYQIMKQDSFKIVCDLGLGESSFTSYGCDLSYEYVKINAEYRT
jgi:glutamate N-acetyltransferase/amino-acid N-acetyltransferase